MKNFPASNGVSLSLAGNGYVSCSATGTLNGLQSCTIEAWIMLAEIPSGNTGMAIAAKPGSQGFGLFLLASGGRVEADSIFGTSDDVSGGNVTVGKWHHLAGVYDAAAGTVTTYLDGAQVAQKTGIAPQNLTSTDDAQFMIGAATYGNGPSSFFNGQIGSVRVWGVARTQDDLLNDAVNIAVIDRGVSANLRLFVDFSAVPAVDRGGGNNQLSFTNASYAVASGGLVLSGSGFAACRSSSFDFGGTSPYTIDGWFYPQADTGALVGSQPLLAAANAWNLRIAYESGSQVDALRNAVSQPGTSITSKPFVELDNWHHFAVTYNEHSQVLSLYINGNLHAAATALAAPAIADATLLIGAWMDSSGNPINLFSGVIQNIRVWNVCLMQADVRQWMYNQPVTSPSLLASFDFTQSPAVDLTGNSTIALMAGAMLTPMAVVATFDAASDFAPPVPVNAACLDQRIDPPADPPPVSAAPQPEAFSAEHFQANLDAFLQCLPAEADALERDAHRRRFEDGYARARQMVADNPNLLKVVSVVRDGSTARLVYHGVAGDMVIAETTSTTIECTLWWVGFTFTLTIGFLSAMGLLPPVGQVATRLYNLLIKNVAVAQQMTLLISAGTVTVSGCFALIKVIYDEGLMWSVLKLAIASAGFWALFCLLRTILLALGGGAVVAQAVAGFIVWSAQIGVLVNGHSSSCPR
jgi:hypothetical protein